MSSAFGQGWQLILADLALILFLVTLSALALEDGPNAGETRAESEILAQTSPEPAPQIAASQALFRPIEGGPSLAQWLAQRPRDARATLTVFARYSRGDRRQMWQEAQALADQADGSGFTVRVVITQSSASDLHASLAYDAPNSGVAN